MITPFMALPAIMIIAANREDEVRRYMDKKTNKDNNKDKNKEKEKDNGKEKENGNNSQIAFISTVNGKDKRESKEKGRRERNTSESCCICC